MNNSSNSQKKERLSRYFLLCVSLIGIWIFIQFGLAKITAPNETMILALLVVFLLIVEFFPLPVWKGTVTISFPLVYAIYVMDGLSYTVLSYGCIVAMINLYKRRPLRIVFFNPALLLISFYTAHLISQWFLSFLTIELQSRFLQGVLHFSLLILPFYLVNNLIVDVLLTIRPQLYNFRIWKRKTLQELNSFLLSYGYLVLFYFLGNQNRGEIDVFSFFFFFAPLVCFALLSSIIANLKKEKSKLKALFSISSELNKKIAAPDWLSFLANNLQEFIDVDAWILWKREKKGWNLRFASGLVMDEIILTDEAALAFDKTRQLTVYHHTKKDAGPAGKIFSEEVGSLLYAPLVLENELVGMFVFGRVRSKSFTEEDRQSAATLANQLAVLIKTKWLFAEQEKRLILEERNRIARDIHDGVAQSLAGAIMNLETATRKFTKMPDDSFRLMVESTEKLRRSLKEVRESIYALRPYPTERVGLLSAIASKISAIQRDSNMDISFDTRGPEFQLSPMVEKIIFDICKESMQNALKHAEATKIDILLSYQKEHVLLKIKDNGKGFSLFQAMIKARQHPHFGILHMNEAAEKIQASLQVDSKEGAGTEITLTVPRMGIEGSDLRDQAYASR
ncbi:histidine kinase [Neobacillus sp. PS2-9]|uniref:GAF domain-containing sensor histidine kinase n=1 Tax=Neobacillus sp. PS2-9 TaxID=3070676 RepID=UPI0027E06BAB|nr:histidine kinase [Neobacillus sp. PS2-9]WML58336.1 histidine kinase [Neobacillus sp. PS2-9]